MHKPVFAVQSNLQQPYLCSFTCSYTIKVKSMPRLDWIHFPYDPLRIDHYLLRLSSPSIAATIVIGMWVLRIFFLGICSGGRWIFNTCHGVLVIMVSQFLVLYRQIGFWRVQFGLWFGDFFSREIKKEKLIYLYWDDEFCLVCSTFCFGYYQLMILRPSNSVEHLLHNRLGCMISKILPTVMCWRWFYFQNSQGYGQQNWIYGIHGHRTSVWQT